MAIAGGGKSVVVAERAFLQRRSKSVAIVGRLSLLAPAA
jgi:hypothetical protein